MHFRPLSLPLVAASLIAPCAAAPQQGPAAPWRTIRTKHFRIHYPLAFSDWAQEVAGRVEGIHTEVVKLVGYASPKPIEILIQDPYQMANGAAFPFLDHPFVVLWRTPPESDQLADSLTDWTEELVAHELTHMAHLMRPQNQPSWKDKVLDLPVTPIALKVPTWLAEGYATLCEGRLTGSGRPHSLLRAAILRQWSIQGKLPAYGALSGDGYLGRTTSYLMGSAYLEWLERQRPQTPDILQRFWKQLCSKKRRNFEQSFQATFGFSAQDGYDRFRAELAHDALAWEQALKAQGLREGELWLRTSAPCMELELSPDGKRLLARSTGLEAPGLRVWETQPDPSKKAEEQKKEAKPDANEVEDAEPEFKAPKELFFLPRLNGQTPEKAQWLDDQRIGFQLRRPDSEGVRRLMPALWEPGKHLELHPEQLAQPPQTVLQPVLRKGRWVLEWDGREVNLPGQPFGRAVFLKSQHMLYASCAMEGTFNLVRVPLTDKGWGEAQQLTRTASAATQPAPSPDGKTLFYVRMDARGGEIRKLDLSQAPLAPVALPLPGLLTQASIQAPPLGENLLPKGEKAPDSEPYHALDNQQIQPTMGVAMGPSGESFQYGISGMDLVGRTAWRAVLSEGSNGGPSGAQARFTYRGWTWEPTVNAFLAREKPSSQRYLHPQGLDRERLGGEFSLLRQDKGESPWWISPVLAWEQDSQLPEKDRVWHRSLAGLSGGAWQQWTRNGQGLKTAFQAQAMGGRTDLGGTAESFSVLRADLKIAYASEVLPLSLKAEGGSLQGSDHETFHWGGMASPLVSQTLDVDHVVQSALPAWSATGNRFLRWRGEAGSLLKAYVEGTSLWSRGQDRGPFQRVAGLEFSTTLPFPAMVLTPMQSFSFTIGAHTILDGPLKKHQVMTFSFVMKP